MTRTKNISLSYEEYEKFEKLNQDDKELVLLARKTALSAYAPYSKFRVGAAIRLENGDAVCGANVENAAFPSGICAERSAISNLVSNHHNIKPIAIAVAALNDEGLLTEEPVSPCGNCRQVLAEEESRSGCSIRIILSGKNKTLVLDSISSLLPLQFNKQNLKISLP